MLGNMYIIIVIYNKYKEWSNVYLYCDIQAMQKK